MPCRAIIIGGTRGIGHALSKLYVKCRADVTIVERHAPPSPDSDRFHIITADLSLASGQDEALPGLRSEAIDTLETITGDLSVNARVTTEGDDAVWMVNYIARKWMLGAFASVLINGARVGHISTWGSSKAPLTATILASRHATA